MLIGTNTLPRYYLNYFTFPKMDNRFARQANDTSIPIKSSVRLALLPRFIYCINLCPRLLKNSPLPKWVEINFEGVSVFSYPWNEPLRLDKINVLVCLIYCLEYFTKILRKY